MTKLNTLILSALLLLTLPLAAQTTVLKYAHNDPEMGPKATALAQALQPHAIHLSVLENEKLFQKDGALVSIKMGYINLYTLNAMDLQGVVDGLWPLLDRAKSGEHKAIEEALNQLGFKLIAPHFLANKTLLTIAHPRSFNRLNENAQALIHRHLSR